MLSDSAILRFMDGLLSRMPTKGISVVSSTATLGWRNVHAVILESRGEGVFDYSAPFPVIGFNLKGVTTLDWKRGLRLSRIHFHPGELLITPSGDGRSIRSRHPNVGLFCFFDPFRLRSLAEEEWELSGSTIEIVEAYNRDAELWALGQRLAARLRSPIPGSRLFAETLYTQIAIELLSRYSSLPRPTQTEGERLSDPRLRSVIDYLHDSLGEEISLDGLARVAGLSPNYFISAFKRSTGRTPHYYLTELRIARAREFLENPYRSIADISLAVGFSSQSHMTSVFRRFMKTTPAAYRAEALGLHPNGVGPSRGDRVAGVSGCLESSRSNVPQSSFQSS
jgi:AraC family transcriptional regulator